MAEDGSKKPHPAFAGDPADLERFRTSNRHEINRVLRDLSRSGALATLYFNAGNDFVLSSIVKVDSDRDIAFLDYGADPLANERLVKADKITLIAHHNKVRVQFTVDRIAITELDGIPSFAIAFPQSMIRVQRREFYRLSTPVAKPLLCRFHVDDQCIEARVIDISLGGIGLLEPESVDTFELEPGQVIDKCEIELPEEGVVETAMEVRNAFEYTTRTGVLQRRVGCRFLNITPPMNAQIQRYIHRIELERRRITRGDLW